MSAVNPPPCERSRNDFRPAADDIDDDLEEEVKKSELLFSLSQEHFLFHSSSLEPEEEEAQPVDGSGIQDGDLRGLHLERRWALWHQFMKEHTHLDAWLRLAEQAISSSKPAHFTFTNAKQELKMFERLRQEAGPRLVQLDGLTQRNRTLTQLFEGAMRARLLAAARDCSRRWDDVNGRLEAVVRDLQGFVSEWEEFEARREELALWLADMDVSLSAVDQLRGSTCEKLQQLQSFQQRVCVNSAQVNGLLQRGEALIQRSHPADAQHVESHLLELLRHCNHVYNDIARTHTRLLSMRLVFEDDWILSQATDSGCPSESLLEDEGALQKPHLDLPAPAAAPKGLRRCASSSPLRHPPSPPTQEQQGLEWDPSVDVGRSVSREDADSSYFSASTGRCHGDGGLKRWSFLSSLDSQSNNSINNQEADEDLKVSVSLDQFLPPGAARHYQDRWTTSTPDRLDGEPGGSVGGRVEAWLGVQSPAHSVRSTSCSRAVQTEFSLETADQPFLVSARTSSPDREAPPSSDWTTMRRPPGAQAEAESRCQDPEGRPPEQSSSWRPPRGPSALLCLLLSAALVLLACMWWLLSEPPCQRSVRLPRTFHLALTYVNGPPPT